MSLFEQISSDLLAAIKSRNQADIRSLQGIKAALLLLRTEKGKPENISPDDELKVLQKMAKQRRDSLEIFQTQQRPDLAQKEEEELTVIERYLPAQLTDAELEAALIALKETAGVSNMAGLGKLMGLASKELAGKADGKRISEIAKKLLA